MIFCLKRTKRRRVAEERVPEGTGREPAEVIVLSGGTHTPGCTLRNNEDS